MKVMSTLATRPGVEVFRVVGEAPTLTAGFRTPAIKFELEPLILPPRDGLGPKAPAGGPLAVIRRRGDTCSSFDPDMSSGADVEVEKD